MFECENGILQGEVQSVMRANLLMMVWVRAQTERVPRAIVNCFFDDSSVCVKTFADAKKSMEESETFDTLGGASMHKSKSVVMAIKKCARNKAKNLTWETTRGEQHEGGNKWGTTRSPLTKGRQGG